MTDEDEVVVLSDGAIVKNGRLLDADEEQAERENLVLLGDVLKPTAGIAAPRGCSQEIARILALPAGVDEKRSARLAQVAKALQQKAEETEQDEQATEGKK